MLDQRPKEISTIAQNLCFLVQCLRLLASSGMVVVIASDPYSTVLHEGEAQDC